jgi:integrase
MPRKAKELSAKAVRDLTTPGRHAVGGVDGLALMVKGANNRSWSLRLMIEGKRRELGLGGFPDVSLAAAREEARKMKDQTRRKLDPLKERAKELAKNADETARMRTFEEVATECFEEIRFEFKNTKHAAQWISTLKMYAFPKIGTMFVDHIERHHIIDVLQPIWTKKTETATRVRGRIQRVLAYARAKQYRKGDNPAVWTQNLEQAFAKPRKIAPVKHHPRLPVSEVPRLMEALRQLDSIAARAMEFAILTAARVSEVRFAKAKEFDLGTRLWTIPAERMKAGLGHRVPLSDRAVQILRETQRLQSGGLLFPGVTGRGAMSENTQNDVIRQLHDFDIAVKGPGFFDPDREKVATAHGMRSTFKDWARTKTNFPDEVSEIALAHVNSDATRVAYARDDLLELRATMMEQWSQYCFPLRAENVVVLADRKR